VGACAITAEHVPGSGKINGLKAEKGACSRGEPFRMRAKLVPQLGETRMAMETGAHAGRRFSPSAAVGSRIPLWRGCMIRVYGIQSAKQAADGAE
jgi:hypothetical protein